MVMPHPSAGIMMALLDNSAVDQIYRKREKQQQIEKNAQFKKRDDLSKGKGNLSNSNEFDS